MKTRLARRRAFRARRPDAVAAWTDGIATDGAHFSPAGLTQEFQLELVLEGEVDPDSGMILNIADVDRAMAVAVAPIEGSPVPTTAALAQDLLSQLIAAFRDRPVRVIKLRLNESPDLWVDAWA